MGNKENINVPDQGSPLPEMHFLEVSRYQQRVEAARPRYVGGGQRRAAGSKQTEGEGEGGHCSLILRSRQHGSQSIERLLESSHGERSMVIDSSESRGVVPHHRIDLRHRVLAQHAE